MNIVHVSCSLVVVLVMIPACLDYQPTLESDVPHDPVVADASAASDAGAETSSASNTHLACLTCTETSPDGGGACGTAYTTCADDAKCIVLFRCAVASGCFVTGAVVATCLTPCGEKAGLTSSADPVVALFTPLYLCAVTTCATACSQ